MLIGLETFPAQHMDTLLDEICRIFEYQDTPITQEIIDHHFAKIDKVDFEELDENSQQLVIVLLDFFDCSFFIELFYVYIRCGPYVYFENDVLKFPKIIARRNYG